MAGYRGPTRHNSHGDGSSGVAAGHIFWLPLKDGCDESLVDDRDLNDGCFDHPILVLTANCNVQMAVVLIVS